jgi:hypothetical protein
MWYSLKILAQPSLAAARVGILICRPDLDLVPEPNPIHIRKDVEFTQFLASNWVIFGVESTCTIHP